MFLVQRRVTRFRLDKLQVERVLRSRFWRDGSIVFVSTMTVNVLNYVYHMLCSRILGVDAYGNLATLIAMYMIAGAVVLVINLIVAKFTAEFHALDDNERLSGLTSTMMRVCYGLAVFVIAVFGTASRSLSQYLHVDWIAFNLALVAISAAMLAPTLRGVLQGVQDYRRLAISLNVESLGRLVGGVGLAYAGFGVRGAMAGWALGNIAAYLYSAFAVRHHVAAKRPKRVDLDLRRLATTSGGIALATVALTLLGFIDVLLVKHYFSASEAGMYGVLSLTGKIIMFSVSFVPTILLPKAVTKRMHGESARGILTQAVSVTIGLSVCSLLVFLLLPQLLIKVLVGSAFLAAAPYIFWYGAATSLLASTTLTATYKIGIHEFAFLPHLLAIVVAEIIAISFYHPTIFAVVELVLGANLLALLVTILPGKRSVRGA